MHAPFTRRVLPTILLAVGGLAGGACSGSSGGPTAPSPTVPGTILTGHVVDQFTGQPVSGLAVRFDGRLARTDDAGRFSVAGGPGVRQVVLEGSAIFDRWTWARGGASEIQLKVLPFDFEISAFEDVAREYAPGTVRWVESPSVYVDARADRAGADPDDVRRWADEAAEWVPALLAEWSAGAVGAASVTVGTEPPPSGSNGTLVVRFDADPSLYPTPTAVGAARMRWNGGNAILSADIWLRPGRLEGPTAAIARRMLVAHEVGHAVGLAHMDGAESSVMTPVIRTPGLTDLDRRLGRVLYARPPGNTTADRDPSSGLAGALASAADPAGATLVVCDGGILEATGF